MTRPRLILIAAVLLVVWLIYWSVDTFAVSEETQMLRVQKQFVTVLEQRKWSIVDSWVSSDYSDGWGQGPDPVKQTMRRVLGGFFGLSIEPTVTSSKAVKGLGMVGTKLLVQGTGAGISSMVVAESKRIKEPWVFHWHKRGFWPWNWELVEIANPELTGYKIPKDAMDALGQ